ncbi:MAG: hypothetical protein Q8K33_01580 [Cypionkella sp.]|uniref:hypothetical protein n=1 Tax=Cypionkella sp. TaxID=2811411 RepID=UPI0027306288|nr:hypothetical protein [Cypionkella sp.]MDP2047572.1 hypothetical protein [Cypionkella sp.]
MKIWNLVTDSDAGTFSEIFYSEALRDARCYDLCADQWDAEDGPMSADWRVAYAVMQGKSCDWWFHLSEHDISGHPDLIRAPVLLTLLPNGETLDDLCRRERVEGFDVRFSRPHTDEDSGYATIECAPGEAEFVSIYAMTDLGEPIAIHDAKLSEAGADEVAATCRALFKAIVLTDITKWTKDQIKEIMLEHDASGLSALEYSQLVMNERASAIMDTAASDALTEAGYYEGPWSENVPTGLPGDEMDRMCPVCGMTCEC